MAFTAGTRLTAQLLNDYFPAAGEDDQADTLSSVSSSYAETGLGGTACSFTFIAPTSGRVMVHNTAQLDNSTSQTTLLSYVIREGGTIGSGTVFQAASDDRGLRSVNTNEKQMTWSGIVTGLTAGATYNIRQAFRSNGGATATASRKLLSVVPTT